MARVQTDNRSSGEKSIRFSVIGGGSEVSRHERRFAIYAVARPSVSRSTLVEQDYCNYTTKKRTKNWDAQPSVQLDLEYEELSANGPQIAVSDSC